MKYRRLGRRAVMMVLAVASLAATASAAQAQTQTLAAKKDYNQYYSSYAVGGYTSARCIRFLSNASWWCTVHTAAKDVKRDSECAVTRIHIRDQYNDIVFNKSVNGCPLDTWVPATWYEEIPYPRNPAKLSRWVGRTSDDGEWNAAGTAFLGQ